MVRPWSCCTAAPAPTTTTSSRSTTTSRKEAARSSITTSAAAAGHRSPATSRWAGESTWPTPFRVTERTRKAVWDSLGKYDLRPRMRQTFPNGRAPRSLLLHGIYDPMPLEAARETAALLSTGVIELATGHAPHVEATAAFARALDGFLPPH